MKERVRKDTRWWRYTNRACGTYRSLASCNDFFGKTGKDRKAKRQLRLVDIASILWVWTYSRMTTEEAAVAGRVSKHSICKCYSRCRTVNSYSESALPKLKRIRDQLIQIDESYSAGRRKYNRGILARGDIRSEGDLEAVEEMEIELSGWVAIDPETEFQIMKNWTREGRGSSH